VEDVVGIVHGISPSVTAITGATAPVNNHRKRYFIAVPKLQYAFHNLPTRPLFMMSNTEFKLQNASNFLPRQPATDDAVHMPQSTASAEEQTNLTNTTSTEKAQPTAITNRSGESTSTPPYGPPIEELHVVPETPPRSAIENLMPWIIKPDGSTADGLAIPRNPGDTDTSSGAFHIGALTAASASMAQSLNGCYVGTCHGRRDFLNPITGEVQSRPTGRNEMRQNDVVDAIAKAMRDAAIQCYFGSRVSPKTDTRHLASDVGAQQLAEIASVVSLLSRGAPRSEADVVRLREARKQRRRVMNRLSAARSNHKKREELEKLRDELDGTRRRLDLLTRRRESLSVENETLRRLAFGETEK